MHFGTDETRQLTLERERQLASDFAFISASTDDMLRVMAICVEESSDQQGMTIRLASNTGDLSRTLQSFKGIANTLERAAIRGMILVTFCLVLLTPASVDSRVSVRQDLYRQILSLDKTRILSRLRSKHAARTRKTAGKPALADLLLRSIKNPSIHSGKSTEAKLKRVRLQSDRMSETFAKFEAIHTSHAASDESLDTLAELLCQASEFDTQYLQTALHTSSAIGATLQDFLSRAIRKLGRYYSIANDLVDAARSSRYTIFRRILVEALERPATNTTTIIDGLRGFEAVLKRNLGSPHRQGDWQRHSRSLKAARTRFQSRISNCATPWKVHAEIQLLFFYEQNQDIPHPRIICSSKSACYLCDLFIKSHGKFYTPSTHDRLYDKWILPDWATDQASTCPNVLSAIERFNTMLETRIVRSLRDRQLAHPHPNESSLQLREPWSSTSTLSQSEQCGPRSSDVIPPNTLIEPRGPQSSVAASSTRLSPADIALEWRNPAIRTQDATHDAHADKEHGTTQASLSSPAMRSVSREDIIIYELSSPASTLIVRTDVMNLYVSYEGDSTVSSFSSDRIQDTRWIQVEWLASDGRASDGDRGAEFIDVDTIPSGQDLIIDGGAALSLRPLAIRNGEHTIFLQWFYRDPRIGQETSDRVHHR